jgi:tRNA modification GTPase
VRAATIFALSSGAVPAGIAIVRMSGPAVRSALETLIDSVPEPRKASLAFIRWADRSVIDRGLVVFFPGPRSVTGEDVAELHVHGGRAVVAALLQRLGEIPGTRPAEPGEFTRRAFQNGRIDLTEAEGLADLINAETEAQRRQAVRQASGTLRATFDGWRSRLVKARAMVEAELDFADEEDVPASVSDSAWEEAARIAGDIAVHLDDQRRGERLRDGAEVVLVGPVNAGKSSLINALVRRDVAIVSSEPGTTRDTIEVRLDVEGYPFTLVDTAGLREAEGAVEREGMRRARLRAGAADLILALYDVTSPIPAGERHNGETAIVRVGTKIDLIDSVEERTRLSGIFDVLVSSETGEGFGALFNRLLAFARDRMRPAESSLITRERHRAALEQCRDALVRSGDAALPLELRAEELRHASDALARLTGRIDVEDLLDVIFRDFCIGKLPCFT